MIYVLITYLFYPLLYLVTSLRKKRGFEKILVIQTAKIGDMICSTPVFREVKKKYPMVNLSVIANPVTAELLKYNPYVDNVITLDTKNIKGISGKLKLIKLLYKGEYDVSLSLNPNIPFAIAPLWALIPIRIAIIPNFCGTTLKLASGLNTHNERHETGKLVVETYMKMLKAMDIHTDNIAKEVYKSPEADKKVQQILWNITPSPIPSHPETGLREGSLRQRRGSEEGSLSKEEKMPSPLVGEGKVGNDSYRGEGELKGEVNKPLISIAVSSGNKLKELGQKKITGLANTLLENMDIYVALIGSKGDSETADKIFESINKKDRAVNATGKLSLTELPALIEKLSLFVGVDSGITYMADALSIPLIDIAGPSDMNDQRPLGKNCIIMQQALPCVPCSHAFRAPYSCKRGDRICITSISISEIVEAAKRLLRQ